LVSSVREPESGLPAVALVGTFAVTVKIADAAGATVIVPGAAANPAPVVEARTVSGAVPPFSIGTVLEATAPHSTCQKSIGVVGTMADDIPASEPPASAGLAASPEPLDGWTATVLPPSGCVTTRPASLASPEPSCVVASRPPSAQAGNAAVATARVREWARRS
jgi:hypothetical protein